MPKTKQQKKELVKQMAEKISRSKAVIFADYQGLTMKHLKELRQKLQAEGAEFNVTKNTLLSLALKERNLKTQEKALDQGATATLFSYEDELTPLKTLVKALKDIQIGKIKAGIIDDIFYNSAEIMRLASLPGRLELRAQVVSSLSAPLYGLANVLQANLRNLVFALEQIRLQKGGE